jgi:hypothetical protein
MPAFFNGSSRICPLQSSRVGSRPCAPTTWRGRRPGNRRHGASATVRSGTTTFLVIDLMASLAKKAWRRPVLQGLSTWASGPRKLMKNVGWRRHCFVCLRLSCRRVTSRPWRRHKRQCLRHPRGRHGVFLGFAAIGFQVGAGVRGDLHKDMAQHNTLVYIISIHLSSEFCNAGLQPGTCRSFALHPSPPSAQKGTRKASG